MSGKFLRPSLEDASAAPRQSCVTRSGVDQATRKGNLGKASLGPIQPTRRSSHGVLALEKPRISQFGMAQILGSVSEFERGHGRRQAQGRPTQPTALGMPDLHLLRRRRAGRRWLCPGLERGSSRRTRNVTTRSYTRANACWSRSRPAIQACEGRSGRTREVRMACSVPIGATGVVLRKSERASATERPGVSPAEAKTVTLCPRALER